jgi:heat-inducible transcriptional repressor
MSKEKNRKPGQPGRSLTERERKILYLLVYYHIATGEPVGSRFLSKKLDLDISPATVRNIMADLEEAGFLRQTHPSSGRVPTDLGYRCYVDLLIKPGPPKATARQQIRERLLRGNLTFEEVFQSTSRTLSAVSRQLGIVVGPRLLGDRHQQLQFVRIGRRRVLAVIISGSGLIQNKMLELPEDWTQEELSAMSELWNRRFGSCSLREVREELLERMAADKAEFDRLMETALTLGRRALLEEDERAGESIYLEGTANMFSWPEFASPEKLRNLMNAIEEKSRLLQLLDRSLQAEGIQIYIGEEMPMPEMKEMSLITAPYRREGKVLGVLGVIGPTRMEYSKVIPIVEYTAASLSEYLSTE